jgi:hypothetical protein
VKDTTAPTVVIDQPVDGSTVRGIVAVKISATDNTVISKVEVYLDGTLYRTLTTAPYSFNWDTSAVKNGSHVFSVKAIDIYGNAATDSVNLKIIG